MNLYSYIVFRNTVPSTPVLSRSQSLNSLSSVSTAFDSTSDGFSTATLSSTLLTEQSGPSFAQVQHSMAFFSI